MKLSASIPGPGWALLRERWGWPGAAAVLALAGAAWLGGVLAPRWQAQAQAQLAGFEQASLRAHQQRAAARLPATAGAAWPGGEQTPQRVASLLRLATPAGLRVLRSSEQAASGGHLQLSLTASGPYPAMRRYLSNALAADAALVLQQVRLQRDDDDAAPLRIELRWVLLQDSSAPPRSGASP